MGDNNAKMAKPQYQPPLVVFLDLGIKMKEEND